MTYYGMVWIFIFILGLIIMILVACLENSNEKLRLSEDMNELLTKELKKEELIKINFDTIKIMQLEATIGNRNRQIEELKNKIYSRGVVIDSKNKTIESLIENINELQNKIDKWFTPKVSKNDGKDVKPSLVKSFKKREPIIKAFRYSIDEPDYLKQKLEELDAKCVSINFLDGSMIIKKYNDEELTVLEGQYIVNVDGNLQVMYSNDFRRFYEEE